MRFFSPMSVNPHPGGFAQRRISELPSVTAPQMREIQRVAQEDFGVDILQIIENAGRAGARLALGMLGGKGRGQRIVVLAGGGNKGAAGLCMARTLVNWGFVVDPVLAEVQGEMAYVARRQVQILKAAGIVDKDNEEPSEFLVEEQLASADLVIDALIGYGLEGPPTGMAAAVTDLALQSGRPILALDVPTGVNASTGLAAGIKSDRGLSGRPSHACPASRHCPARSDQAEGSRGSKGAMDCVGKRTRAANHRDAQA